MLSTRPAQSLIKRAFDLLGVAVVSVVVVPVVAWVALAVAIVDGRPIFFRQERPGLGGRPFTIVKFRTMRPLRPGEVPYVTDKLRLTRLGRFLRDTSLDELPELWNVLRGDMSLVGPRPLLMEYLAEYRPEERRRHDMRPGITGWAVVNGRNTLRFDDRLELDVWYVEHWSVMLDLWILATTAIQVLRRTNASTTEDLSLGFRLPDGFGDDPAQAKIEGPPSNRSAP
jgi:sugar transferase EpsL